MAPFLAAVIAIALLLLRGFRTRDHGDRDPAADWIVIALLALPLLYAAAVLWAAGDRLGGLQLRYVGKQVAWGPGIPLTIGGGVEGGEDLHDGLLAPDALRLEAADEETAEALGVAVGSGYLRLARGAPIVRVDGEVANAIPLEAGDRLVLSPADGGEVTMVLDGDDLVLDGDEGDSALRHSLPGPLDRLLRPGRVGYLPDVLADLAPDWSEGARAGFRSVLEHDGGWRLLVRDAELRVERSGEPLPALDALRPVPREFELRLQVAWGGAGDRRLRTVRTDRVRLPPAGAGETVEIRFGEPQRRRVPREALEEAGAIGLVVPTAIDRRPELVELDERSRRFHGLAATLRFDEEGGGAVLEYLGARWEVEPDELYGLGDGSDRMLLRLEHGRSPTRVLVDLVLYALFCAVFLGRVLRSSTALSTVMAGVGLLLADRLLFAFRTATEPPHYLARSYGEARLAIWLVPALVLAGWTAAVLLRRSDSVGVETPLRDRLRAGLRPLAWPLAGLATAALGCYLTVRGPQAAGLGNLRALALVPLALAALLLGVYAWAASSRGGERLGRWRAPSGSGGWSWALWALPAAGGAILAARLLGRVLGMPEALRLPGTSFRILWSALQLPVAAIAFGLGCQLLAERGWPEVGWRRLLLGLGAAWGFVFLAFVLVGEIANDRGLMIVHALAPFFALLLVVGSVPERRSARGATTPSYVLGAFLALLPLLLVVAVNRWPQPFVEVYDRVTAVGGDSAGGEVEGDAAARHRASPEQQRFRLLMLANPELLTEVGLRPSEQTAVQYQTIKRYAANAGLAGGGYSSSELPRHLGVTYQNDLMAMAFVLADFGKLGMLGLALTYLLVLAGALPVLAGAAGVERPAADRWARQGRWIATVALLSFALPGLYMTLANLNLVLFTGKNASLLALNSTSDVLQSGTLLGVAAFGLGLGSGGGPVAGRRRR
jgi:hypothetical protein